MRSHVQVHYVVFQLLIVFGAFKLYSCLDEGNSRIGDYSLNKREELNHSVQCTVTKLPSEMMQPIVTYTIEVLVAVDKSMKEFHGMNEIEEYVLTLLLIASDVFADVSIGHAIKLAVGKIIFLDADDFSAYTFYSGIKILGKY